MLTTQQARADLINLMYRRPKSVTHLKSDQPDLSDILDALYNTGEPVFFVCDVDYQFVAYITKTRAIKVSLIDLW